MYIASSFFVLTLASSSVTSRRSRNLYDLTKTNVTFRFGETKHNAFKTLKAKLTKAPVSAIYNPNNHTELHCNASSAGFGAVLMQKKADGKMHPVFYYSRRTSESESNFIVLS